MHDKTWSSERDADAVDEDVEARLIRDDTPASPSSPPSPPPPSPPPSAAAAVVVALAEEEDLLDVGDRAVDVYTAFTPHNKAYRPSNMWRESYQGC